MNAIISSAQVEPGSTAEPGEVLRAVTLRLMRGEDLNQHEAAQFLHALVAPAATDAQIAAALAALAIKGETVEELAGMAEALRTRAVPLRSRHHRFIDTAGTGSSAAKTFNVSTAAAFVIAGAGLPVAKHGGRAATSRCGSADVLEALGVNTAAPPEISEHCLNEHGICFMSAPLFHRATARVASVRRQLGVPTTFNLLGPLSNPSRVPFQIVGVSDFSLLERVAAALSLLDIDKAWVVHGADGLDEITLTGETFIAECSAKSGVRKFTIAPHDFGLTTQQIDKLRGGGPVENAQIIRAILHGEKGGRFSAARDLVIANAAAALHVGGVSSDLGQGAALARESIETGRAAAKLDTLVRETNRKR
jgi:anthranilate phosphoribosyltransferase